MRIFRPLRNRSVALLWSGMSLSALGDQLYAVALTWIAVRVFGSGAGYLSALQALIGLLATLGIGRWVDRFDQLRSMIVADFVRAAALIGVVATWLLFGGPTAPQLIVAIVVLAVGQAVFRPALEAVLPGLVEDPRALPGANGLLDATDRSARLLGPGLVAMLAGVVPMVHFLTLDAVSFLVSAVALRRIGKRNPNLPITRRLGGESLLRGIARGARAMNSHPLLGYALSTTGLLNGTWFAVYMLALPLMIAQDRAAGAAAAGLGIYGLVLSNYGCTNLASTVVFGGRPMSAQPQWLMFGGNCLVGAGLTLLGLANLLPMAWHLPAYMAATALGAIGGPMKDIPLAVLRQTRLRPTDKAAGMRAYMSATSAGILLTMLVAPSLIALAGTVPLIVACGSIYMTVGCLGLTRYAGWREPEPVV